MIIIYWISVLLHHLHTQYKTISLDVMKPGRLLNNKSGCQGTREIIKQLVWMT